MLVNMFLSEKEAVGCSVSTLVFYRSSLDRFFSFLASQNLKLSDFDKTAYFTYLFSLRSGGLSAVSVQSYIRGLKCFFSWAFSSGYVNRDLNSFCVLPKAPRPIIVPLSDDEISCVFKSFSQDFIGVRNKAIFSLFLGSGIRLAEALAPFSSLSLDHGFLLVHGKGDKDRFVPLSDHFISCYRSYLSFVPSPSSLFSLISGEPLTYDGLKDIFRKIAKDSGVSRLYPHLCRHSFASRFIEEGGDLFALKEILGHSSLEICKRYIHMSPYALRKNFHSPLDRWCSCADSNRRPFD